MKIFYSPKYFADLKGHIMPIEKFRLVKEGIEATNLPVEIVEPEKATEEGLMRVHTKKYIDAVMSGEPIELAKSQGFPWSQQLAQSVLYTNGGCMGAAHAALEDGVSGNLASGFHHATREAGANFCTFNGLAVAIRELQAEGLIERAMVIDCDLHYGNGTAGIFSGSGDCSVFTFSIYGVSLDWPIANGRSNHSIKLPAKSKGKEYLGAIENSLPGIISEFDPQFIFYQAGADPFKDDMMSNLDMEISDLAERDRKVFQISKDFKKPIAYVLAGGYPQTIKTPVTEPVYAGQLGKIVAIHVNTFKMAKEVFG